MSVAINRETGKWDVQCAYSNNLGRRIRKHKRGFGSEEDALAWEEDFLRAHGGDMSVSFTEFCEMYLDDNKGMLKPSTMRARRYAITGHFVPCFGSMGMHDIRSVDIHRWQGSLMDRGYSATYLRTLRNQLSAIFNHAVAHYGLVENPVSKSKPIGSKQAVEMQVWTKEEYKRFSEAIMDKPRSFMAFEVLYWCGLRRGELLALTADDIDLDAGEIVVSKSLQRIDGTDIVTSPKTPASIRRVSMPPFLKEELADYILCEGIGSNERLFPFAQYLLAHEMQRGCAASGVKRIRIHDLRHSHVSLLIEIGFDVVSISKRLGHSKEQVTLRYAHMFPNRQREVADALQKLGA